MASKKKQSSWVTILLLIVGVVSWYLKNNPGALDSITGNTSNGASVGASGDVDFDVSGLTEARVTTNEYTVLEGCELVDYRNNDGDSFMVKHPEGENEVRLYYVDTAESRRHKYNGDRLADQGAYFGGLTEKQTTDLGVAGKKLTLGLLKGKKFTMVTKWEMDPSGERPHVYVFIDKGGKQYYLHEILASSGLVRTKTLGRSLPDGTSYYDHIKKVRALENQAKTAKRGGWGIK